MFTVYIKDGENTIQKEMVKSDIIQFTKNNGMKARVCKSDWRMSWTDYVFVTENFLNDIENSKFANNIYLEKTKNSVDMSSLKSYNT